MRIVITVPSLAREFGGPQAKASRLVKALREAGYQADLVGCGTETTGTIGLPTLIHFHGTPIPRAFRPLLRAISGASIVHIIGYRDPVGVVAAGAARKLGIPYVLEPVGMLAHRSRSFRLKRLFDETVGHSLFAHAAGVISTSKIETAEFHRAGNSRLRTWERPNGVDPAALLPLPPRGEIRRRYAIPPEAPFVLTLARLASIKGLEGLCRALADAPGLFAIIAGPDQRDGTLERIVELRSRLGLNGKLIVVPEGLWGEAKRQALADADCLCLPSAYESFGTAAVEAAIAGLPVVISDRCGVQAWLRSSSVRVVPYGDRARLSIALIASCGQVARREAEQYAGTAIDAFAWATLVTQQTAIYGEALAAS